MVRTRLVPLATAALALVAGGAARAGEERAAEGTLKDGVRTVEMAVTENGFEPARVLVSRGEKVRLLITRKTDDTCATEIVIEEQGVNTPLPLGTVVAVEFTPKRSGEIRYACGMGHVSGVLLVR